MSIITSLSVGNGDMFYIRHGSDNFTMIDCSLPEDRKDDILDELKTASAGKTIRRFISTHPDQDHISGLVSLDERMGILNFYCVANKAIKSDETDDFKRYKQLRDDTGKAFYLYRDCNRRWMNQADSERDAAGLSILWPVLENKEYLDAKAVAEVGESPNNMSIILKYELEGGITCLWMGDLETDFMERIAKAVTHDKADVLFAPHHGRKSGRVLNEWLNLIDPQIIVVGEAPSQDLEYYSGFNTITQLSAGDILFECLNTKVHVFVSRPSYHVDFLSNEGVPDSYGSYLGTFYPRT